MQDQTQNQDHAQAHRKKRKLSTCQRISDAAASLVHSAPLFSADTPSRRIIDKVKNAKERAARTLRRMSTAIGLGGRTANPAQSPKEEPWVSSEPPYDFSSSPTAYPIRNYPLALPVPKETKPFPHCPNEILSMIAVFANQWNMAEVCKNWERVMHGVYPDLLKAYYTNPVLRQFYNLTSGNLIDDVKRVYREAVGKILDQGKLYQNEELPFRIVSDKTSLEEGLVSCELSNFAYRLIKKLRDSEDKELKNISLSLEQQRCAPPPSFSFTQSVDRDKKMLRSIRTIKKETQEKISSLVRERNPDLDLKSRWYRYPFDYSDCYRDHFCDLYLSPKQI